MSIDNLTHTRKIAKQLTEAGIVVVAIEIDPHGQADDMVKITDSVAVNVQDDGTAYVTKQTADANGLPEFEFFPTRGNSDFADLFTDVKTAVAQ